MSLNGFASVRSFLHDLIETLEHQIDKIILGNRKSVVFVSLELDRSLDFINEFPKSLAASGAYFSAPLPAAQASAWEPELWDAPGRLASYSLRSEVGDLERRRLAIEKIHLPPGESLSIPKLARVSGIEHFTALSKAAKESASYHRFSTGAGKRMQWKATPVRSTAGSQADPEDQSGGCCLAFFEKIERMLENPETADIAKMRLELNRFAEDGFAFRIDAAAPSKKGKKNQPSPLRKKPSGNKNAADLLRYTINTSPPLARAMLLAVENGAGAESLQAMMVRIAPLAVAKFEKVTGRRVVAASVHWDSSLPHINLWHTGLEKVVYEVKGEARCRYRRTAMNLNSSGGLLAWDRCERAFARLGEKLEDCSKETVAELRRGEERAMERQRRMAGDIAVNRFLDSVLERELKRMNRQQEIEEGFEAYVENEKKRYEAGKAEKLRAKREAREKLNETALRLNESEEAGARLKSERDRAVDEKAVLGKEVEAFREKLQRAEAAKEFMSVKITNMMQQLSVEKEVSGCELARLREALLSGQRRAANAERSEAALLEKAERLEEANTVATAALVVARADVQQATDRADQVLADVKNGIAGLLSTILEWVAGVAPEVARNLRRLIEDIGFREFLDAPPAELAADYESEGRLKSRNPGKVDGIR